MGLIREVDKQAMSADGCAGQGLDAAVGEGRRGEGERGTNPKSSHSLQAKFAEIQRIYEVLRPVLLREGAEIPRLHDVAA